MRSVLADAIQAKGVKQAFLAEQAGISPSHLTRALQLQRPLALEAIQIIARLVGVQIDDVFDGEQLRASNQARERSKHAPSRSQRQPRKAAVA